MKLIDFNAKRFERAIADNRKIGGTVMLAHPYLPPDFKIAAPIQDLYIGVSQFENINSSEGKIAIKSINSAIQKARGAVLSGNATTDEAVGMAQDITLYTAYEIVQGRLSFDDLEYAE